MKKVLLAGAIDDIDLTDIKFVFYKKELFFDVISFLSQNIVDIIVIFFKENNNTFINIKNYVSNIPIIAVISNNDIELAYLCGVGKFDRIISYCKVKTLIEVIESINTVKVDLFTIGIRDEFESLLIKRAMKIIEKEYVRLFSVKDIAERLFVTESTLYKEFGKYNLPAPKKIIMDLKICHALYLMQNFNYSLKQIANYSGFTCDKRFSECFYRIFHFTPGEIRKNLPEIKVDDLISQIWVAKNQNVTM